jgi:ribose 5-phosphate isomerase B
MIYIASDHRGLELKKNLISFLKEEGINFVDLGPEEYEGGDSYVDYAVKMAASVIQDESHKGIFICGNGGCIVANKVPGIIAGLCLSPETVKQARQKNNINVLCMGGEIVKPKEAQEMVKLFMSVDFLGGKYEERLKSVQKIDGCCDDCSCC